MHFLNANLIFLSTAELLIRVNIADYFEETMMQDFCVH